MTARTVLFLCEHNAGRSQLAAHLLTHTAPDRFIVRSAGTTPAGHISPEVARALADLGIDTTAATPHAVTATDLAAADIVVTMKPGLNLPSPVGGELIEWEFPNPENWDLNGVRALRDHIHDSVRTLVDTHASR